MAYFIRNLATIVSRLGFETPSQLLHSMKPAINWEEKHKVWYMTIKGVIHVVSEDQRPPTLTALKRHWARSCWIKERWANSSKPDPFYGLVPPETQGWLKDGNGYSIEWEAPDTRLNIQGTLDFLGKGCSCKTGCKAKRSCQKNAKEWGCRLRVKRMYKYEIDCNATR